MTVQQSAVTFLANHRIRSPEFGKLLRDCSTLVDETATYLTGQGKEESCELRGPARSAYKSETERLTTNMLKYVMWLLLHRSIAEGEGTLEDFRSKDKRVELPELSVGLPRMDLPETLRALIVRLQDIGKDVTRLNGVLHPLRADSE